MSNTHLSPLPRPSRRTVLGTTGALALSSLAIGCRTDGATSKDASVTDGSNLPSHVPSDAVTPDIPSVNGSTPGYLSYPAERPQTVPEPPGTGQTFTAMVPTWSAVTSNLKNAYTDTLDAALGSRLEFQMTTGNDYIDRQSAVFAAPDDVADWVSVFGWNPPPRFAQAVEALFQDLTDFLKGDAIEKWPNLAALPTEAWRFGMFDGKLYGIPVPGEIVTDAIYYRADIFERLGLEQPHTADEFLTVCKELTAPDKNQWATNDLATAAPNLLFGAPPDWRERDGKLEYRWETQEYRDALEFQIELFEKGYVHPDVAADAGDAKQRFESGKVAIHYDGVGAWGEANKRLKQANPEFRQLAMSALSASGGDPVRYTGNAANFFSFLKKSDDPARIEELLGIANYLAAPYGTQEWETINFGEEGVHFTRGENGEPIATEQLGEEHPGVLSTLVAPAVEKHDFEDPDFVTTYCEWMQGETEFMVEGPFYGYQVQRPVQWATLDQPMWDLEKDVVRGRKTMDDFDAAVTNWRDSGGEEMREHYQGILEEIRSES